MGSQECIKKQMLCLYSRHESSYGFGRIMCHASDSIVRPVHNVELLSPSPAAISGALRPIGQHPEDNRVEKPSLVMVLHGNGAWNPPSFDYTACWNDAQDMMAGGDHQAIDGAIMEENAWRLHAARDGAGHGRSPRYPSV